MFITILFLAELPTFYMGINIDGLVKSHVSDGFGKSSRSRLANL